jgi:hypothetical protein
MIGVPFKMNQLKHIGSFLLCHCTLLVIMKSKRKCRVYIVSSHKILKHKLILIIQFTMDV